MKLFVWRNVPYDYTAGIIFAVADSVEEARGMITDKVKDTNRSIREGRILLKDITGEPDVIEGKWVEWLWGGS